jgi:hypothetical protein
MNRTEYLLVHLMEEASELQKACSKALRFGLAYYWARESAVVREKIADEYLDVAVLIQAMIREGVISNSPDIGAAIDAKIKKMYEMYQRSIELGRVTP